MFHVWASAFVLTLAFCLGCRLPGHSPVSSSVLSCRELSQQGISAMEQQDWQRAEKLLAEAVETCNSEPEARRHYAEALWRLGRSQEAITQMTEAVRLSNTDANLRVRLAEMQLEDGQLATAYRGAELAIDLDPRLASAWALRGRVMKQSGQPRRALADYQRALSYEPTNRDALLAISELYRALDQPQLALTNLQSLADTYPPSEEPQHVLHMAGLAFLAMGRYYESASCLAQACQRQPPTAEILADLAAAQMGAGYDGPARRAAEEALRLEPQFPPAVAVLDQLDGRALATAPATLR